MWAIYYFAEGLVSTPWIDEHREERMVVLMMSHVLRAFLGCDSLPRDIRSGLIQFHHASEKLSSVNTCGPCILFSQTKNLEQYNSMASHLMYIIVGAPGFGIE